MVAKCPKCENVIGHINAVTKDVHVNGRAAYKGVLFCCPYCFTALSADIDPIAIKADIINAVKKATR